MATFYLLAGLNHFIHPDSYTKIIPYWLPYPKEIVFISGVVEMGLAIFLLPLITRIFAAWGIIVLLIVVFPANIQMAIQFYREHSPYSWLALLRLFFQPVLIIWSYKFTKPQLA